MVVRSEEVASEDEVDFERRGCLSLRVSLVAGWNSGEVAKENFDVSSDGFDVRTDFGESDRESNFTFPRSEVEECSGFGGF